jgi:hypothetical protein
MTTLMRWSGIYGQSILIQGTKSLVLRVRIRLISFNALEESEELVEEMENRSDYDYDVDESQEGGSRGVFRRII